MKQELDENDQIRTSVTQSSSILPGAEEPVSGFGQAAATGLEVNDDKQRYLPVDDVHSLPGLSYGHDLWDSMSAIRDATEQRTK